MKNNLAGFKLKYSCNFSRSKLIPSSFRVLLYEVNPFWLQLSYFTVLSLFGYLALKFSSRRSSSTSFRPNDLDIFFTSVSSATVSSMSTVEMEVFSNTQLIIMTILMLVGGEVFTSMIRLQLEISKFPKQDKFAKDIELDRVTSSVLEIEKLSTDLEGNIIMINNYDNDSTLKYKSFKFLRYVVLGYLLVVHVVGSSLVAMYTSLVSTAREVITSKGIKIHTFSAFTTVSTFSNCGFVPTNENMMVFKKNSGLLLILIPQILSGNTLYAPCLRFLIWALEKMTKRVEFKYILMNTREMGYGHLLSSSRCLLLAATVMVFIFVQFALFCSMEWNSEAMDGLNSYQKFVAVLFQVANSRHAGESVFDLSVISPAVLVLFVFMMYLPPYTSFLPRNQRKEASKTDQESKNQRTTSMQCLLFSQLSYLVIFVILICITERDKMKTDSLNFNVLNITIEVISAYGNVGFSTGYSCKRKLIPESSCKDAFYGFVGRWSNKGKIILILVMFLGRHKEFAMKNGWAWTLS